MIMEEMDKILEDKILREFKENRRGFLNKLRSKKLLAYKAIHLEQISNA